MPRVSFGTHSRGTETLLVVEDDNALRRVTSLAFGNLGYTVLQADNGREGLRIVNEHRGLPISLVITDIIMPQMGGKAMAEQLKTTHPDLKILFFCSSLPMKQNFK